ncbi:hypothetical protein TNCV_969461 [Trichonephila clavipes]|nr:hypothetical protein TNCV_969461 [Trichonephila clavipes]
MGRTKPAGKNSSGRSPLTDERIALLSCNMIGRDRSTQKVGVETEWVDPEITASANQIAGKWCDCSFGRQIDSVAVPAELFCPSILYLLNLILSKIINSALNSKILMRRYVPFRDRHSVSYMPLAKRPEQRRS